MEQAEHMLRSSFLGGTTGVSIDAGNWVVPLPPPTHTTYNRCAASARHMCVPAMRAVEVRLHHTPDSGWTRGRQHVAD